VNCGAGIVVFPVNCGAVYQELEGQGVNGPDG
jgi:hypothetical protein